MLVLLALLFTAGAPMRMFGGLGVGLAGIAGILAATEPYRLQRLTGFRNPCAHQNALGVGYQACQGLYALSSGGWFGVGLGASREKFGYLPNQYTDYIFAIIGEELGLLGTLAVLGLFALLGYAGIRIAQRCKDRFSQLAAAGVVACYSARPWSTWARWSGCCRSPGSRCPSFPSAARPWFRRCSPSEC
jgi:cell division protein FtsW